MASSRESDMAGSQPMYFRRSTSLSSSSPVITQRPFFRGRVILTLIIADEHPDIEDASLDLRRRQQFQEWRTTTN